MNDYAAFYRRMAEMERNAARGNRGQRRSGAVPAPAWESVQNIAPDQIVDEQMALDRARVRAREVSQREQPYEGIGFFDPTVAAIRNTTDAAADQISPYQREGETQRRLDRREYWGEAARGTGRFLSGVGNWLNEHALDDRSVHDTFDPAPRREAMEENQRRADQMAANEGVGVDEGITVEAPYWPTRLERLRTGADDMLWTGVANARDEGTQNRVIASDMARYWREHGDDEKAQAWESAAEDSAAMHTLMTGFGAAELIPGWGAVPALANAGRGTLRLGYRALGQEVPQMLRAPVREVAENAPGPLTANAQGWRNNFLLGGGAYLAADASDGDIGDDPGASLMTAGGAMVAGRRLLVPNIDSAIPAETRQLMRQGEMSSDGARNYTPRPRQRLTVDPEGHVAMDYEGSFNTGDGANVGETRSVIRGAREALDRDIADTRRSEYSWTPNDERQAALYRREFERDTPTNYAFSETPQGTMRLRRLGAQFEPDPLQAQRVPDDAPYGFEGAPQSGRIIDAEATPAPSMPQRRFEAAVRDPETGQVYTGVDHLEAIDSAPEAARARLQALYDAPTEDPNAIGFVVDGQFMGREEGLQSLRSQRRPVRVGEQVNRDGSVTPASPIDWENGSTRLPADDEWFNNLAGMPTPPRMNIAPDSGVPGMTAEDMLRDDLLYGNTTMDLQREGLYRGFRMPPDVADAFATRPPRLTIENPERFNIDHPIVDDWTRPEANYIVPEGGVPGRSAEDMLREPRRLGANEAPDASQRAPGNVSSAPDGGASGARPVSREQLRAEGFDVDRVYYHGTGSDFDSFQTHDGFLGDGVYITPRAGLADWYAGRASFEAGGEGANIRPIHVRGRIKRETREARSTWHRPRAEQARRDGYAGYQAGRDGDIVIFDPANIVSQFGRAPNAPNAGNAAPRRLGDDTATALVVGGGAGIATGGVLLANDAEARGDEDIINRSRYLEARGNEGEETPRPPMSMRLGGAIGAGLIVRNFAGRVGARGVAQEIPGMATAYGANTVLGGDPNESAIAALSTPAVRYAGEEGGRRLGQALEGHWDRQAARSLNWTEYDHNLNATPAHNTRVRDFAMTLPGEITPARSIQVENYHADAPRQGRAPVSMGDQEAVREGYYSNTPGTGEMSPRDEFLAMTPSQQEDWMDRQSFRMNWMPEGTQERVAQGRDVQARALEGDAPVALPAQEQQQRGMPPMNRRTRGERTAANVQRRAGTRPAGQTLDGFIEAAGREGVTITAEGKSVAARARAIADAIRNNPRLEQLARDWGLAALLTAGGVAAFAAGDDAEASTGGDHAFSDPENYLPTLATGATALASGAVIANAVRNPARMRLGQASRLSELPMDIPTRRFDVSRSRLGRVAPNRVESDIDPRVVAGGAALAAGPIAWGAAELLDPTSQSPQEQESSFLRDVMPYAEMRQQALELHSQGYTSREIRDIDPELADEMLILEQGGNSLLNDYEVTPASITEDIQAARSSRAREEQKRNPQRLGR